MHRLASLDPASTPWASNLSPNRATCSGSSGVADGVQRLVPGGQHLAGLRVQVGGVCLVPDRQPVPVEADRRRGGPPHLVVGRGDHLAQFAAGDGAADRHVHVRREPALRFDGGEVLQVIAAVAAQVLDEPVEQRGEVQRVPRGRGVVIAGPGRPVCRRW